MHAAVAYDSFKLFDGGDVDDDVFPPLLFN